jgi:hypothetical protein
MASRSTGFVMVASVVVAAAMAMKAWWTEEGGDVQSVVEVQGGGVGWLCCLGVCRGGSGQAPSTSEAPTGRAMDH